MPYTKEQRRVYQAQYRQKRRDTAIKLLGGACVVCGTTENLEINHIDPTTKSFTLSRWDGKASDYWEEVKKCNLLCKAHHDEETARQKLSGLIDSRNYKYR